jgi:hypothetical protein
VKYVCFLLLLFLLFASCSIEQRIERREDRLVGTWQIDKASFKEDDELFADNITDEFRGDRITFFPDFSLRYDAGTGELFDGVWRISALREFDDNDLEFAIDADFFDPGGRIAFQWIGIVDRLTDNNFNVDLSERNGRLRIKWDKR